MKTFKITIFYFLIFAFSGIANAAMDIDKRGKWLNVFPFGVGQYQNYQEGKALFLLTTQATLFTLTLTSAFLSKRNDEETNKYQKIELYSFLGFVSLYLWGVYDSFKNYEKTEEVIIKKMEAKLKIDPQISNNYFGINLALSF